MSRKAVPVDWAGLEEALTVHLDDALRYFDPRTGGVVSVHAGELLASLGQPASIKHRVCHPGTCRAGWHPAGTSALGPVATAARLPVCSLAPGAQADATDDEVPLCEERGSRGASPRRHAPPRTRWILRPPHAVPAIAYSSSSGRVTGQNP